MFEKVVIYGFSEGCRWCDAAKHLLSREKIPFDFFDVKNDLAARAEFIEFANENEHGMTVPMIVIGGKYLGGFDELEREQIGGSLMDKVKEK